MKRWDFRNYDLNNDLQFLDNAREHIEDPYIRERLVNRLEWYMVTYSRCKIRYYLTSCVSIIIPTIILFLNSAGNMFISELSCQMGIALLSGFASIVGALAGLYQWHDNMVRYRANAELLKKMTSFYMVGIPPFKQPADKDALFLKLLENLSIEENQKWQELQDNSGKSSGC